MVIEAGKEMDELIYISNKLMTKLKQEGASDIVLHCGIGNEHQVKFANNKIVKTDSSLSKSLYIFCNWDGKIIETTLKKISEKEIQNTIERLKKYKKYIPKNEKFEGIAEGPFKYKKTKYDKTMENAYSMHVDVIETALDSAIENMGKRNGGVFETSTSMHYLLTSGKCEAEGKNSSVYFSLRSVYDSESSGHKVYSGRTMKNFKPEKIGEKAAIFAYESRGDKEEVSGNMDIVFEPLPLAIILEAIADSASAFAVETGNSFLVNKLGKRVGSKIFTLIDDPTYEDAYIHGTYDSEGVATKKKKIIDNGILKTYLHNTSTAKRYKTKTTGNAGLINPHPWNVVMEKGKYDVKKLISSIDNGIYVTNAWYMRFQNYFTGEFSIIPRDATFLIKNGRIVKPIKNVRINATLEDIMKKTEMIGNNIEKIHSWEVSGSVITPSILVRDVNITNPMIRYQ